MLGSVFVNPMRDSIDFGVFVGLWSKWCCRVDRFIACVFHVRLLVYLTHPPSQSFVPSVGEGCLSRSSKRFNVGCHTSFV